MTLDDIKSAVVSAVTGVAPEIDPLSIHSSVNFRDELDLDSMDFLNLMIGLHEALKVEIQESDYAACSTLEGCVERLAARLGATT